MKSNLNINLMNKKHDEIKFNINLMNKKHDEIKFSIKFKFTIKFNISGSR